MTRLGSGLLRCRSLSQDRYPGGGTGCNVGAHGCNLKAHAVKDCEHNGVCRRTCGGWLRCLELADALPVQGYASGGSVCQDLLIQAPYDPDPFTSRSGLLGLVYWPADRHFYDGQWNHERGVRAPSQTRQGHSTR